jgi:hypothetical protein
MSDRKYTYEERTLAYVQGVIDGAEHTVRPQRWQPRHEYQIGDVVDTSLPALLCEHCGRPGTSDCGRHEEE